VPFDSSKKEEMGITIGMLDQMSRLPGGLGPLPLILWPADNPQGEAKIQLGKRLFFDKALSRDRVQSCASCHNPENGFSDGRPRALGLRGKELPRHSPSVLNSAYNPLQFWDGRAKSLEEQAEGPMLAPAEMNMTSEDLVSRLKSLPEYSGQFRAVFDEEPTLKNIAKAIATYERTLVTPNSRFDAYARGDKNALSNSEKRGLILFIGKAACAQCHTGGNFTDNRFHRLGLPLGGPGETDLGRFAVTGQEEDRGSFKTPSLRNVALTAPYMHNGMLKSLEAVVEFYDRGGNVVLGKSALIFELGLSGPEKADLVAFLKTLTGEMPGSSIPVMSTAK
jgi:cytochrome c peroxidase